MASLLCTIFILSLVGGRKPGDNFMYYPHKIVMKPELFAGTNLTAEQICGLMKIYRGLVDPATGERIYEPTMMPGSEACDLGLVFQESDSIILYVIKNQKRRETYGKNTYQKGVSGEFQNIIRILHDNLHEYLCNDGFDSLHGVSDRFFRY